MISDELKALIEDLRINHEYNEKEIPTYLKHGLVTNVCFA